MTMLRSRSLATQFRALFTGGTLSGLGEGELLDRFVGRRDESAFEELIARHGPMVLAVCRRWLDDPEDVEDAFQTTFLVLIRKAGGLRDRQSVAQWLYGVSHRVARHARSASIRNRERAMRMHARRGEESARSAGPDPSDELAGREIRAMVDDEILRLPEKQQAAAVLGLVQGMTHEGAARALGWPLGTFKTRIAEARATLARRLARRGVAPGVMVAVARSESAIFPPSVLPDGLAGRTLDAAMTACGPGGVAGTAAVLARGVCRGMLLTRATYLALGALAAFILSVPAWIIGRPAAPLARPAVAQAAPPSPAASSPKVDRHGDPLPNGALMRLGTSRYRQGSPFYRIAYTPDGTSLVTDGDDGKLRVWDAATGRVIRQLDPEAGASNDFGLKSDGKSVMTAGLSLKRGIGIFRNVTFTEIATGRVVSRVTWPEQDPLARLALRPDQRLLAVAWTQPPFWAIRDARVGGRIDPGPDVRRTAAAWPSRPTADGSRSRSCPPSGATGKPA